MKENTEQQLREELLLEFEFNAPKNWGEKALSEKLQALRDKAEEQATLEEGTESKTLNPLEGTNLNTQPAVTAAQDEENAANLANGQKKLAATTSTQAQPAVSLEPVTVLMLTLINHEVPGSNPRQVRAQHEHFYTDTPKEYAGVAKVVAEVAPEDAELDPDARL